MASIAPAPIFMNDATVKIGATDNYEKAVSSVKLTPTVPTNSFKGIDGTVTPIAGKPVWTVTLTWAQDWKTTGSLSQYMLTNTGVLTTLVITPQTGGKIFTIQAILLPGEAGGDVDSTATTSVTMPVSGQPVLT